MSRCWLKSKDEKTVVVGIQNECWFIQVFQQDPLTCEDKFDLDINCSRANLISYIDEYADTEDLYVKEVMAYINLDLDPGGIEQRVIKTIELMKEAIIKEKEEKKDSL